MDTNSSATHNPADVVLAVDLEEEIQKRVLNILYRALDPYRYTPNSYPSGTLEFYVREAVAKIAKEAVKNAL